MSFLSCVPCGIACEQLIYLHDGAFGQLNPCGIEDASESIHLTFSFTTVKPTAASSVFAGYREVV